MAADGSAITWEKDILTFLPDFLFLTYRIRSFAKPFSKLLSHISKLV